MIFTILVFIFPISSYAYLDPGTGSMLLSSIFALAAIVIYSAKNLMYRVVSNIGAMFGHKVKQLKKFDLVFYSEGEQYFSTFYPILREMTRQKIKFTYLYSGVDDRVVKEIEGIDAQYIGEGNKAFFYLNYLEAKMCVLTTPGLDILQIKRSKGVEHYCCIHHATRGFATNKVFSFDCYDSLLLPCEDDKKFFELLEKKRGLPAKDIRAVGTAYLDIALEKISNIEQVVSENGKKIVLISPTWGSNGLLAQHGEVILEQLISCGRFKVIVRPHPHSVRFEQEMLGRLKDIFGKSPDLEWDYENDNLKTLARADLMVSDFSGIILDFAYLFNRPVISYPSGLNLDGRDYINREDPIWFNELYAKLTTTLKVEDIDRVEEIVDSLLEAPVSNELKIIMEQYNPYFGEAGVKTAGDIVDIYEGLVK